MQLYAQSKALNERKAYNGQELHVNVVFHIVSTEDQANSITPVMVSEQFAVLATAYASANISFTLINTTYSINDDWATDSDDDGMKSALRQGTYDTLNIFYQTNLTSTAYGTQTALLGYCTLPVNITYGDPPSEFPPEDYSPDGCNVLAGSMPGGPVYGYNLGKTTVHEVGHWFGLLHTFQDNTCDPSDPGDMIADTPQEGASTNGCPVGKKSCVADVGYDPIHNYMDYSTDACYEAFTPDQFLRMHDIYKQYREGY